MTTIQWFEPQAYKTLSNSHGIEIMINNTGEEVSYRYSDEGESAEVYASEIQYDQEGEAYFKEYRGPYKPNVQYLNEFMKY